MKSPSRASKIVGALALALVASAGLAVTPPAQAAQNVVVTQLPDQTHPRVLNGRIYAIATAGDLVANRAAGAGRTACDHADASSRPRRCASGERAIDL